MLSGTAPNSLMLLSHTSFVDEGICMKKGALKRHIVHDESGVAMFL
jgi:threonine aldolase